MSGYPQYRENNSKTQFMRLWEDRYEVITLHLGTDGVDKKYTWYEETPESVSFLSGKRMDRAYFDTQHQLILEQYEGSSEERWQRALDELKKRIANLK